MVKFKLKKMKMNIKEKNGFTLVEILVAIVVLAIALVPLIGVFTTGSKESDVAQKITVGTSLAQDLLEEIRSKQFDEDILNPTIPGKLGPEKNEQRFNPPTRNFDDVDDYNGYNDSPPEELDGTVMSEYAGYNRSVIVEYVNENDFNIVSSVITKSKRISVNVAWDADEQNVKLVAIKGNY